MFAVSSLDGLSELGDAIASSCGAGGILFLVTYVVVGATLLGERAWASRCSRAGPG